MRNGSRSLAALTLALVGIGLLTAADAPGTTSVTVTVTDLRNAKGVVRACITSDPKHFPNCKGDTGKHVAVVPAAKTVVFKFEDVAPGQYAITLFHDENDNGKLDRALLMMPKEGYGFSRDAKVVMSPPKFSAAAFEVGQEPNFQTIRMRYMF